MSVDIGLTVRRFERHTIRLDAQTWPTGQMLRFSAESGIGEGKIRCVVTDLSEGGLGIVSPLFVPRRTVLRVRLLPSGAGGPALPEFEAEVRVQRVAMADRTPSYSLGCAFTERSPTLNANVQAVLSALAAHRQASSRAGVAPC